MFLIFLILNIILEMEQKIIGGKAEIRRPSAQPPLPSAPTTTTAATAARGFSPVAKGGSQKFQIIVGILLSKGGSQKNSKYL